MKNKKSKFWLIFINILNVSLLLFVVVSFILLFSRELPEEINKDKFISYMENKGCKVIDVQGQEDYLGVDTYLVTNEDTCPYLVGYTKFLPGYSND